MPFEIVVATVAACVLALFPSFYPRGVPRGSWDARVFAFYYPALVTFTAVLLVGHVFGPVAAIVTAVVALGFLAARVARGSSQGRELQRLCARLGASGDDASVAALDAALERLRRTCEGRSGGYELWGNWVLHAAGQASVADRTADALRWASAPRAPDLSPTLRALQAQCVAAFAITLGERDVARKALAQLRRPAPSPAIEQALLGIEGVLEGLEGDPEAARRRADRALATKLDPRVRIIWQMARAHALATLGESAEVRALLAAVREEHGDFILRRIARQAGPASPLASTLLDSAAPYR
jgi:hypothetical protein